jgi:hypothetical protein
LGKDPRLSRVQHPLSNYEYEETVLTPTTR